jgi:hypothetical protein
MDEVIDRGSRRERSDAMWSLLDLVGSDTPDRTDAFVSATNKGHT